MRKTMIIPTYWCRKTGDPWQEGDAVYDHPTPVDQEGTLERTLVSMKQFHEKDFKLVILICPTTPEVEAAAYEQVLRIVVRAQLNAETYLFTAGDLREITEILRKAGLNDRGVRLPVHVRILKRAQYMPIGRLYPDGGRCFAHRR